MPEQLTMSALMCTDYSEITDDRFDLSVDRLPRRSIDPGGGNVTYSVPCFRDAGLEAEWANTPEGKPGIYARDPSGAKHSRDDFWLVDADIYAAMHKLGCLAGFRHCIRLGDLTHSRR